MVNMNNANAETNTVKSNCIITMTSYARHGISCHRQIKRLFNGQDNIEQSIKMPASWPLVRWLLDATQKGH